MSAPLKSAPRYTALGLRVHPLATGSKKPLLKGWPARATTSQAQIDAWADEFPNANIGIPTGQYGHLYLVVVDLDTDETGHLAGADELNEIVGRDLPPTLMHSTPSGGAHLFFWSRVPVASSRKALAAHIDVRGVGGQIVAPPSIVDTPYTVLTAQTISEIPEVLLAAILASKPVTAISPVAVIAPSNATTYAIDLRPFDADPEVITAFEAALAIEVGVKFHPTWRTQSREPSAVFDGKSIFDHGGPKRSLPSQFTKAEAYFAHLTGRARTFRRETGNGAEHFMREARMLTAFGVDLNLPPVDHPALPDSLSALAQAVFAEFLVRWQIQLCSHHEHEVAFSDRFARDMLAVTGWRVGHQDTGRAKGELERAWLICKTRERRSGKRHLTFMWKLGEGSPDSHRDEAES